MKEAPSRDDTYRQSFLGAETASTYDEKEYAPNSFSDLLWQIEQKILLNIVTDFKRQVPRINYLDFACGTGRIISVLEQVVDSATGIEISPDMLNIANSKVHHATLLCKDITAPDSIIEDKYDLITTFRFILNAEPPLRVAALKQLVERLRDDSSLLILNSHGNPWSHKLLLWPFHSIRQMLFGRRRHGNYLTNSQVKKMLDPLGLDIVSVTGIGFISPKFYRLVPPAVCEKIENKLAGKPFIQAFGANQIFVARRRPV